MKPKEKTQNTQKKQSSNDQKNVSTQKNNIENQTSPENINLIKPIAINPKLISPKNENSTIPSSNINPNSEIAVIYPQFQLRCISDMNNINNSVSGEFSNYIPNNRKNISKKNNYENDSLTQNKESNKPCCSCTKTKCIKKYCECFANKRYCVDCHCSGCLNNSEYYKKDQNNSKNNEKIEKIICTCEKSNCNKKYCECFKAGIFCNSKCRCLNCKNKSENGKSENIIKEKIKVKEKKDVNLSIDEEKSESKKNSHSHKSSYSDNSFKIQRVSVYINKNQTYINVEKCSKADMKLLGKKTKK